MSIIDDDQSRSDKELNNNNNLRRDIEITDELKQIRQELVKLNQYLHIITGEKL